MFWLTPLHSQTLTQPIAILTMENSFIIHIQILKTKNSLNPVAATLCIYILEQQ